MIVTERNYKSVCSKLDRFFKHRSFREWHTFRGGLKKRISHKTRVTGYDSGWLNNYIENHWCDVRTRWNGKHFVVDLDEDSAFAIEIGDEILFCGSRVIIKKKDWVFKKYGSNYTYMCLQIDK